jgi:hypothetical protein
MLQVITRLAIAAPRRIIAIAVVAAALVMTAAIVKLARVEAVSTRVTVEAQLHEEAGSPAS